GQGGMRPGSIEYLKKRRPASASATPPRTAAACTPNQRSQSMPTLGAPATAGGAGRAGRGGAAGRAGGAAGTGRGGGGAGATRSDSTAAGAGRPSGRNAVR